jgi:hypothetical protein
MKPRNSINHSVQIFIIHAVPFKKQKYSPIEFASSESFGPGLDVPHGGIPNNCHSLWPPDFLTIRKCHLHHILSTAKHTVARAVLPVEATADMIFPF